MTFLYPEFIYLMLIPAGLLIYLINTNKDVLERIFDAETLERLRISGDALGRHGHNTLLFVVFFFMALALARPVIEEGETVVETGGVETVVALDLSASMMARDFYPDRLAFAKQKLAELLPRLKVRQIGLIGFAGAAYVAAPLTDDREALIYLLRRMESGSVSAEGSDLASALRGAAKLLGRKGGVVLLVTDGGEENDVAGLAALAKRAHLEVAVWMMATPRGAPVPPDYLPGDKNATVVLTRANEKLRRLAELTGGIYVPATLSQQDEKALLRWFESKAQTGRAVKKKVRRRIELFYYPLLLALLFLPFALYSFGGRRVLGALLLGFVATPEISRAGILDFLEAERGIKAYEKGAYDVSTDAFEKLAMHLDRPEVWLDLGDSYYRQGRYKMACDAYSRVVTADPRIESAKLYNLGNCYVKLGRLEKAAEFYEKVLGIWDDPDARYNLKVVKEALAKMPKRRKSGQKRTKGGKNEKSRRREGNHSAEKGASRSGAAPKAARRRAITPAEERKWMRLIEQQPVRTKLYPLVPPKETGHAKPW